jgi:hypothetical protein
MPTDVPSDYIASIFRVEAKVKQEASMQQAQADYSTGFMTLFS